MESSLLFIHLDKLPEEIFQHILSYLKFEEIDKTRLVSHRFNDTCKFFLKKKYKLVKQEVATCIENSRLRYFDRIEKRWNGIHEYDATWLFWIAVSETLSNSFCYFDCLEGYLDAEYSVSGKTIDLVEHFLKFKKERHPYDHLLDLMFDRSEVELNIEVHEYFPNDIVKWFIHKSKSYKRIPFIYLPLTPRNNPIFGLPKFYGHNYKRFNLGIMDILSTLLKQENPVNKPLLCLGPMSDWFNLFNAPLKLVLKPGQQINIQAISDSELKYELPPPGWCNLEHVIKGLSVCSSQWRI